MSEIDLTLLSKKEVFGPGGLDIFRKHSAKAYLTDFGYVTGAENTHYYTEDETVSEMDDRPLRITADYWLRSSNPYGYPHFVYLNGSIDSIYGGLLTKGIRPIIQNPTCFDEWMSNLTPEELQKGEFIYGTYPQWLVPTEKAWLLERNFNHGLLDKTRKTYTINGYKKELFYPLSINEYSFEEEKYVRVVCEHYSPYNFWCDSNYQMIDRNIAWIKVSPVYWMIDFPSKTLVSKRVLLGGIPFYKTSKKEFASSEIKTFLDRYMSADLFDQTRYSKDGILSQNETLKKLIYRKKL